jgi:hypothetical protein
MYEVKPEVQVLYKKSKIISEILNKARKNDDTELEIRMLKKYKEHLMELHLKMEEIILEEQVKDNVYLDWCNRAKNMNDNLDLCTMLLVKQRERTAIYD